MPIAICAGCGRKTNSATSNYWLRTEIDGETPKEFGVATQCYAAFVMGLWVKGCVYNDMGPMKKNIIAKLFTNEDV